MPVSADRRLVRALHQLLHLLAGYVGVVPLGRRQAVLTASLASRRSAIGMVPQTSLPSLSSSSSALRSAHNKARARAMAGDEIQYSAKP